MSVVISLRQLELWGTGYVQEAGAIALDERKPDSPRVVIMEDFEALMIECLHIAYETR